MSKRCHRWRVVRRAAGAIFAFCGTVSAAAAGAALRLRPALEADGCVFSGFALAAAPRLSPNSTSAQPCSIFEMANSSLQVHTGVRTVTTNNPPLLGTALHGTHLLLLAVGAFASTTEGRAGAAGTDSILCSTTADFANGCSGAISVLFVLSSKAAHGCQEKPWPSMREVYVNGPHSTEHVEVRAAQ